MNEREVKTDPLHEIVCLSINDVLSCCHYNDGEDWRLYLDEQALRDLAKEKTGL